MSLAQNEMEINMSEQKEVLKISNFHGRPL